MEIIPDVDSQMDAWWDVQVSDMLKRDAQEAVTHRCPPFMPPCPDCQDRYDREDFLEFGFQ